MALRNSGMPSTAVYLVSPRSMAAMAAFLMLSGVSKSGSPTPRLITSRPAAIRSRAFCVAAIVGDGLMRPRDSARKPFGSVFDMDDMGTPAADSVAIKAMTYQPRTLSARRKWAVSGTPDRYYGFSTLRH